MRNFQIVLLGKFKVFICELVFVRGSRAVCVVGCVDWWIALRVCGCLLECWICVVCFVPRNLKSKSSETKNKTMVQQRKGSEDSNFISRDGCYSNKNRKFISRDGVCFDLKTYGGFYSNKNQLGM